MPPKLEITLGQHSQTGVKSNNEDFHGYTQPEEPQLSYKGIAIADGMSGADGGRMASQATVVGFFADYFSTPESWTVKHSAQKILSTLNRCLYK